MGINLQSLWSGSSLSPNNRSKEMRERKMALYRQLESIYGDTCSICGKTGVRLSLHHNAFDGVEEREEIGIWQSMKKTIDAHDKSKYSLLCHHCHDHMHRKLHQSKNDIWERRHNYDVAHKEQARKRRENRKTALREYQRIYYQKHKAQIKAWESENREKRLRQMHERYLAHKKGST